MLLQNNVFRTFIAAKLICHVLEALHYSLFFPRFGLGEFCWLGLLKEAATEVLEGNNILLHLQLLLDVVRCVLCHLVSIGGFCVVISSYCSYCLFGPVATEEGVAGNVAKIWLWRRVGDSGEQWEIKSNDLLIKTLSSVCDRHGILNSTPPKTCPTFAWVDVRFIQWTVGTLEVGA